MATAPELTPITNSNQTPAAMGATATPPGDVDRDTAASPMMDDQGPLENVAHDLAPNQNPPAAEPLEGLAASMWATADEQQYIDEGLYGKEPAARRHPEREDDTMEFMFEAGVGVGPDRAEGYTTDSDDSRDLGLDSDARDRSHVGNWLLEDPLQYAPPAALRLVPRPLGGFPEAQGISSHDFRAHVPARSLALWEDYPSSWCLAHIAYDKHTSDPTMQTTAIRDLIKASLPDPVPAPIVSYPGVDHQRYYERRPIISYFVGNLTKREISILVERGCWAIPGLTVFFVANSEFATEYVMTLGGMALEASAEANAQIRTMVVDSLRESIDIPPFLEDYWNQYPDNYSTPQVLDAIVRSVTVRNVTITVNGTSVTYFTIYMGSPTWEEQGLEAWITLVRSLPYSSIFGVAKVQPIFNCWLCKASDHPTGKCPYKDIPGWHEDDGAPKANATPPRGADTPGGRGGRGHTGLGRGRGLGRGNGRSNTARGRF